jgi:hypothetical protein
LSTFRGNLKKKNCFQPTFKFTSYFRRRPSISNLPALLAPVLGDSPSLRAHAKLHNSVAKTKVKLCLHRSLIRLSERSIFDLGTVEYYVI